MKGLLLLLLVLAVFIGPIVANAMTGAGASPLPWHQAPMDSTGLAPDPRELRDAIVQVYAAPAFDWRGIVAAHTWIAYKRKDAARFTRFDVVGWGGGDTVKIDWAAPDGLWYGKRPILLLDRRGPEVEPLIDEIEKAVRTYPWRHTYRTWPGPNSNTFTAHVARQVPALRLDLPANAVGKDFVPLSQTVTRAPSGTGAQVSVAGVLGVTIALEEGVEINLLGLSVGIDVAQPALRLPGIGQYPRRTQD